MEGDDVLRTAAAMRAFSADLERDGAAWRVTGAPWRTPAQGLYFGNSGTGARLVMGAAAGAGVGAKFHGDLSLSGRPMGRVLEPLKMMGLQTASNEGRLPVTLYPPQGLTAVNVKLARPSAQVKSAILLAALGADGQTTIHEPALCRDHTERMLEAFGVELSFVSDGEEGRLISIQGGQSLRATDVVVPGDPSSAAFIAAAATITPNSDVLVKNVLMNPTRIGFYQTLREMGGDVTFENARVECGEDVADMRFRSSQLRGVETPASRAPSMIDEFPILAVLASFALGETVMHGIEELRVKESDRIAAMESGLVACGVDVQTGPDWMRISGTGAPPEGGATVKAHHDHRIAMSFLVMGCASRLPVDVDDAQMITTSFPEFQAMMNALGASIEMRN